MRDRIVDAALELAQANSWESVRLHHIAERLGVSLEQIGAEFREKEEIVDAWFDRADHAMLALAGSPELKALETEQRIHLVMSTWFGAMYRYRKPTREMILSKLEFGHLHYQIDGAMRVSRTVQWIREVTGLEDRLPWRAISEVGLTGIFLSAFFYWMYDASQDFSETRRFLRKELRRAGPLARLLRQAAS